MLLESIGDKKLLKGTVEEAIDIAISEYKKSAREVYKSVETLRRARHQRKCAIEFLAKFFGEPKKKLQDNLVSYGELVSINGKLQTIN